MFVFTSLQIKFLIFIAIVFFFTIGFATMIWNQLKKVEKKALAARQRQMQLQRTNN
jgi:hypothetical protein